MFVYFADKQIFELSNSLSIIIEMEEKLKKQKKDFFSIHYWEVRDYLEGERSNPLICTNHKIAKQIQKALDVKLKKTECVNAEKGLFMFEVIDNS